MGLRKGGNKISYCGGFVDGGGAGKEKMGKEIGKGG